MDRNTQAGTRRKPGNGATGWAVAALVAWCGLLVAAAAFTGALHQLTGHDIAIGLVGLGFIAMASASVSLVRRDLRTFLATTTRNRNRR